MRIGVDIGGTKTHGVAVTETGDITAQVTLRTGFGAGQVVRTAVDAICALSDDAGVAVEDVSSIGVGVPGVVDHLTGDLQHAVNLGVDSLDLGRQLADRLGREVWVENDVNAAAVGAYHRLRGPDPAAGVQSMAYLNLGTGLAAGLVIGGRLWRGAGGISGEIGHLPVDPAGEVCGCGQRGCLETVASGSGVAKRWATAERHVVAALYEAADRGEPDAVRVKADFVGGVAAAVRVLVLTTGVEVVVMGGGISSLGETLRSDVSSRLDEWASVSPFLRSVALSDRITIVPDRTVTAALGAALVAVRDDTAPTRSDPPTR